MLTTANRRPTARSIAAAALLPTALALCACSSSTGTDGHAGDESRGRLVAIADGDLISSSFHDGVLFANGAEREPDTVTIIGLPLPEPETTSVAHVAQSEVSNSALGPPRSLAITPDGMAALVLATRGDCGAPPYAGKTMGDLPKASTLTLLDISEAPDSPPRTVATMDLGEGAKTIAVHPDGDLAVIARSSQGAHELVFVRIDPRHGMWKLAQIPLPELPPSDSVSVATVAFSPSGEALAVTAIGLDQVVFYELIREGGVIGVKRWGEPVQVTNFPFTGQFEPDGRYFIVASDEWGDAAKHDLESGRVGTVTAIRLADPNSPQSSHAISSSVLVGISPEGLAISPDGTRIVTGNMRLSLLPEGDARRTPGGSLTLLSFEPSTGSLTVHGEFDCPAGPQGLAFDESGKTLFVADFDNGVAQEWRVVGSSRSPSLEYTMLRVGIARGVHGIVVAP